jgi:quercetin dioxygenase-like cupin family protein
MTATVSSALNPAQVKVSIEEMKARHGAPPWHERLIENDRYIVTVICQAPGHANDWHYHLVDESWSIYEGELSWTLEGHPEPIHVTAGDWVLTPGNTFHLIQVHGDQPAIRIAISYTGEYHRHERENKPPAPPGARPD